MNTNLSKQLEILNACKEGKSIQVKYRDNSTWCDIENTHIFNFEDNEYRIKLKQELPTSWEDYCISNDRTDKFFIDTYSDIVTATQNNKLNVTTDKNLCNSYEEAEAFRALMQLRLLRKSYVGDWEEDFSGNTSQFCICNVCNNIIIGKYSVANKCLSFPNRKLAQTFRDNFENIIKIAKRFL